MKAITLDNELFAAFRAKGDSIVINGIFSSELVIRRSFSWGLAALPSKLESDRTPLVDYFYVAVAEHFFLTEAGKSIENSHLAFELLSALAD